MQQLVVRIPQQQKIIFEQLAQQKQQTVSVLVREALDSYLRKTAQYPTKNFLLELSKVGQEINGPKNLSSFYKKHLYKNKK